jgi:hypothetical protein
MIKFFGYYQGLGLLFRFGHWIAKADGSHCMWCHEPILAGEDGVSHGLGRCEHIECFICSVVGSVAHQERYCDCYGGQTPCVEFGLPRRQLAKTAFERWQKWGEPEMPSSQDRFTS